MNAAAELGLKDPELEKAILATEKFRSQVKQNEYATLRNEREKATFSMMMKMNPEALTEIRKEFFARRDSITLDEFMYIMQKHLVNRRGNDAFVMETPEQREFGINLYELFKDIDINGDGNLEWQEFTSFTVEKANLLNKRAKLTSIPHYHDSSNILDPSSKYRHRHDISRFVNLPTLGQFAMVEDHKNAIFVFNSRYGRHVATINTEAAPIGITSIPDKDKELVVTSGADMTLSTFSLDDPNPKRRYKVLSTWATPGVQMALTYAQDSNVLYSGATNGNIYSWNVSKRSLVNTLVGHTDIVMNLIMLQKLNNIASASLDKTLGVWDSHTNQEILRLLGHKKGVFDLSYSSDYRLLFSCGFEHDACVWSPFVKSLVYRLKGHHACLVGVQSVPNSPEIITADTSGTFKLWDIRNFQCVQTFSANLSGQDTKDSSKLTCFFHTRLPSANLHQKEDDSRIYAASKMLFSFDQARVVHEATTDYSNVFWVTWNPNNLVIITASERNVIVWDALLGSKMYTHNNISGEEISACCLDDRRRKILIGDVKGGINVYNCSNGQLMKTTHYQNESVVVAIEYFNAEKCFVAGYQNGVTCIFDENDMEECNVIRTFEHFNRHHELETLKLDPRTRTIATAGGSSNVARIWNYDSGKCEVELLLGVSPSIVIVTLMMLHPYPLVATSDTTGNIIIWGSRGTRWQGLRIGGFLNMTPVYADSEKRIRRADEEEDMTPLRALPPPQHTRNRNIKRVDSERADRGTAAPPTRQRGLRNSFNPLSEALRVDPVLKASSEKTCMELIQESEEKWGKISAAQTMCWDVDNARLYTGDDMGNIRSFDIFDIFQDLRIETLLEDSSRHRILGLCRGRQRNQQSALPPLFEPDISDEFDAAGAHYLLGHPGNAMSYLGVQFIWSLLGHHDRIITISLVQNMGILTAGADRLVKMWSFEGKPIGTLLQSVPVGTKSQSWDLHFNIDEILREENENLDSIIARARAVASDPNKPDIERMDFHGMQVGSESAEFSRSELRQRIEKSAKILGLDFPKHDYERRGHHHRGSSGAGGAGGGDGGRKEDSLAENSISSSTTGAKSLVEALKEIKSTDSAIDYELKTKQMTLIQQKRKAHKLLSISKEYEAKTGVKVKLSSIGKDRNAQQDDEEKSTAQLDKLLTATSHFAVLAKREHDKRGGGEGSDGGSSASGRKRGDSAGNNNGNNGLDGPGNGGNGGLVVGGSSILEDQSLTEMNSSFSLENTNPHLPRAGRASILATRLASVKSKIMDSIKDVQDKGARTQSIVESCRKYTSYSALDNAMKEATIDKPEHNPTAEELAELRAAREKKHKELLASLILTSDHRPSISQPHPQRSSSSHHMLRSKSGVDDHKPRSSLTTTVTQSTAKTGKLSTLGEDSLETRLEEEPNRKASKPSLLSEEVIDFKERSDSISNEVFPSQSLQSEKL